MLGVAGFGMAVHYPVTFQAGIISGQTPYTEFNGVLGLLADPFTYLSLALALAGLFIAYAVWYRERNLSAFLSKPFPHGIQKVLAERYYFPQAYDKLGMWIGYGITIRRAKPMNGKSIIMEIRGNIFHTPIPGKSSSIATMMTTAAMITEA